MLISSRSAVFLSVAALVGSYYLWGVRAAGYDFRWREPQDGFYNLLARGFVSGHLYLPIDPSPELLAQPNPWDPKIDNSLKLFDAALYQRHYYIYFGAAPAVLLFAPWRLITGHDLPENFGLFVFCFGGFLFSCGALLELLGLMKVRAGPGVLAMMLLALGLCQAVPFLLNRVWAYEIAIGAGYFCISAAVFCLFRGRRAEARWWWFPASGLAFGLAVACRPHLLLVGFLALALLIRAPRAIVAAFAAPAVLVALSVGVYNYERFGDPFELGTRYQLAGENQGRVRLAAGNIAPGLYYLVATSPQFTPVFPWVRLASPPREFPRPATYFQEPTAGALYLAPFLIVFPLIFFGPGRGLRIVLFAAGIFILLAICLTGWSTQRYPADFLPLLDLATLASIAAVIERLGKTGRVAACMGLSGAIAAGAFINLALAVSGPYSEMIRNKPARFVKIAGWLSPIEKYRPRLSPPIDVSLRVREGDRHLLHAGREPWRYELSVERGSLISHFGDSIEKYEMKGPPSTLRVRYLPESGEMHVTADEASVLRHRIGPLIAAPADVVVLGEAGR